MEQIHNHDNYKQNHLYHYKVRLKDGLDRIDDRMDCSTKGVMDKPPSRTEVSHLTLHREAPPVKSLALNALNAQHRYFPHNPSSTK
jgi:hypothetical protein